MFDYWHCRRMPSPFSSSYYPSTISSARIAIDSEWIAGLHYILPTALLGFCKAVYSYDLFLYPFALFLLPELRQDCVKIQDYDFAQPCSPIPVPHILQPFVLIGFLGLCMDCRIDTGLPRCCNTVRVPVILQSFVPIGFLGLFLDCRIGVGLCNSW